MAATRHAREQVHRRRELRRRSTPAERLLWGALRDRRLGGLKFRRQSSIGAFVVDFVCLELGLVIEVDGAVHDYRGPRDIRRQRQLEAKGFRVLRVSNEDVLEDLENVLRGITRLADALASGKKREQQ